MDRFLTTVDVVLEEYNDYLPNNKCLVGKHDLIVFGWTYVNGALLMIVSNSNNTVCSSSKWLQKKQVIKQKHNYLMNEKHKNTCHYSNYVEQLLISASAVTDCDSISAFASLVSFPVGITSSAVELKISAITAGIKKYKSIIRKKKKHGKIVLLRKTKLDTIEVLISKASIDHLLVVTNFFQ